MDNSNIAILRDILREWVNFWLCYCCWWSTKHVRINQEWRRTDPSIRFENSKHQSRTELNVCILLWKTRQNYFHNFSPSQSEFHAVLLYESKSSIDSNHISKHLNPQHFLQEYAQTSARIMLPHRCRFCQLAGALKNVGVLWHQRGLAHKI